MKKKLIIAIIAALMLSGVLVSAGKKDENPKTESQEKKDPVKSGEYEIDEIDFSFSDNVRNDKTGNWRKSLIATNKEITEYALDYYHELFSSDDEIHAIINFQTNTTNKISVVGTYLDVCVMEYVDKEEHDAAILFSGNLLKEYYIDLETEEVEEIQ